MTIEMTTLGVLPDYKAPDDQFQITIDISDWLETDQIDSVAYSAVDENGDTATTTVLDSLKHTNTTTVIKPYIKGGTHEVTYTVKCVATTVLGDKKTVYVRFTCFDYAV